MDNIKKDMEEVGLEEVDAQDRLRWRQSIRCGDPWKKDKPKEEEEEELVKFICRFHVERFYFEKIRLRSHDTGTI